MGQFFYFYKKLRHPDVIYSTHVSWVLACMLSRCMIKNSESCEILLRSFHSEGIFEGREEEPELFYALSYGKGEFFGVENFFEFRDLNEKYLLALVVRVNFCFS